MSGTAAKIVLIERQKAVLKNTRRSRIASPRWIERGQIILLAADEMLNSEISLWVGMGRQQVGLWRRLGQQSQQALLIVGLNEPQTELRRTIEDVLSDDPRSGSPEKFAAQEVVEIIAVACEEPKNSNRLITDWSHRELKDEVIKRGIVTSISQSHVDNLLNQVDLQPHLSRYRPQVELVCQTYQQAPQRFVQGKPRTIYIDEVTRSQALERIAPSLPVGPGGIERTEFKYIRDTEP